MTHDAWSADSPNRVIASLPQTSPNDEFNRELISQVHPQDWVNPTPSGRYNLVVIGAGTAGLVTAAGAAGLGAKVALIERGMMGGDCLNVGCVPSKALIHAARAAAQVRSAHRFGVNVPAGTEVDFEAVMQRMRKLRARISPNDSAARFRSLGVDVYFGQASFIDSETVDVDGTRLRFKRAVIATGARAAIPSIDGLCGVRYLTNETVFSLTELPKRLGVIGAGPIGCELAQAFAQLGSQVFLVESDDGLLPREDRDAAAVVREAFLADGIEILGGGRQLQVDGAESIRLKSNGPSHSYEYNVDQVLVATGRKANVEDLNLNAVGVEFGERGIEVDDHLRTTNSRIFAAGDVCGHYQFTHAADFMARMVIQNALFKGRKRLSDLIIPWSTYTSPEIAHVGITTHQAREQGIAIDTYTQSFNEIDRAILDGDENGFVKVHTAKGTDQILGATLVAKHAGDLISEITMAMSQGLGLARIGTVIHPYPTHAEAIRKLGDQYNRTRLTPLVKKMFHHWLAWTR
jgi:pyruvate/2-oxoglutarate dehydrogenase complex dihydrolipoamide dehydrogenase (E3) component